MLHLHCKRKIPHCGKLFAIQLRAQDDCDKSDIFLHPLAECINRKNGFSQEFSPRSIMVETNLSCKKHFRVKFGDYAEVHDEPNPRNTISPRTHQEIAVGHTGNFNGTVKVFV